MEVPADLSRDLEGGTDGQRGRTSPAEVLGCLALAACLVASGTGESRDNSHTPTLVQAPLWEGLSRGVRTHSLALMVSLNVDHHLLLLGPCKGPHSPTLSRSRGSSIKSWVGG